MSGQFYFSNPWALLLLPLALLPLLRSHRDTLVFSYLAWLPADVVGRIAGFAWRTCAVLTILLVVIALAQPGRSETQIMRTGSGAEILLLIDRSRSMDERMRTSDWRELDPSLVRLQSQSRGQKKGKVARDLIAKFVADRPNDRFALTFFSANPIRVVAFTQHDDAVQAAIAAGGIGRGITYTDVGWALASAIGQFEQRQYTASRVILLVSDGGAQLDTETRARIRDGLMQNRIALNWIYLQSVAGPDLTNVESQIQSMPEVKLHKFFQSLGTPYVVYQVQTPEDFQEAMIDFGRQQNFPIDYFERIPRHDYSRHCLTAAAFFCLMLLAYSCVKLRDWS